MNRILPSWRTLLPPEHGAWFMLGFPLALGLLLRPGLPSLLLALAAMAAFLARPPLRRVLNGQRDGGVQIRALVLFGGLALALSALTLLISGPRFLIPALAVSPLVVVALWADAKRAVRSFPVELSAQGAFAGLAAAMVTAGGGTLLEGGRAWLFTLLVGGANLAHVRRMLGHARQMATGELNRRLWLVHGLHLLLLAASVALLARHGWSGPAWIAWTLLLYGRALLPYHPLPARILGWREGGLSVLGLLVLWRALI
jgi:hypothetical protein